MAFRNTSKSDGRAAKTAARLNLITAGLAIAETRARGAVSAGKGRKKKSTPAKPAGRLIAVAGGSTAIAGGILALLRRRKAGSTEPPLPPSLQGTDVGTATNGGTPAAAPSNYDLTGPPTNTATPAPATPLDTAAPVIDEEAEIAAAAAEAAAIGGDPDPLVSSIDPSSPLDEAERPLAEAGQGEAEGQEQAEAALADLVSERSLQASNEGDIDPRAQQIDDVIEAQDEPHLGETPEFRN